MNPLLMALLHPYMAPADGKGGDLGGSPLNDRGDSVLPTEGAEKEPEHDDKVEDFVKSEKAEDAEDEKPADDKPRDSDGKFAKKEHVPKQRFDEAVGKERAAREAAEARLAEAEARLQQEAKSVDVQKMEDHVEALEKQHTKLLLDGESEKAAAVMKEIRHAERSIARLESDENSSRATQAAVEQVRMEAAIASLESSHPQFNPDSEEFDQDLVDIVLAEQARLIRQDRMTPSKALTTAATKIMKKFSPVEPSSEGKGLAAAKGNDRKQEQVAKNLDTAKRQPGSMKDSGKDSDKAGENKIDVSALTAAEFAALPDSTKARLRGDTL